MFKEFSNDKTCNSYAVWFVQRGDDRVLTGTDTSNLFSKEAIFQAVEDTIKSRGENTYVSLSQPDCVFVVYQFRDNDEKPLYGLSIIEGKYMDLSRLGTIKFNRQSNDSGEKRTHKNNVVKTKHNFNSNRSKHDIKCDILFPNIPTDKRYKLELDSVAMYSTTNASIAHKISKLCLRILNGLPVKTITDATASIGGNSLSFISHFDVINAIELDPDRFNSLKNNASLIYTTEQLSKVNFHHGDCIEILPNLKQDIIFFDPPWPEDRQYQSMETVSCSDISLSGLSIDALCLFVESLAQYVVFKLPRNFDSKDLSQKIPFPIKSSINWRDSKMTVIIIQLSRNK